MHLCRKRSFALFFEGGEDESVAREHVGECRPWPQQFREKKALCGLAAAAIVNVSKDNAEAGGQAASVSSKAPTSSDGSHILGTYPFGAILGTGSRSINLRSSSFLNCALFALPIFVNPHVSAYHFRKFTHATLVC